MRLVALVLVGCTAAGSQSLSILPPSLDSTSQTIFFGSSLSRDGFQHAIDIYARDSGGVRRLTQIGADANSTLSGFTISADGSRLAYTGFLGGVEVLRSVNLNSGESGVWTCPQDLCSNRTSLHISADNRIILGGSRRTQLPAEIDVANADGSFTVLTRGNLAPSPQRVISSNGLIAFTMDDFYSSDVYVMNLDGGNPQPLTHFPTTPNKISATIAVDATISRSGSLVVFTTYTRAQPGVSQIWAVLSDGLLRSLSRPEENCVSPSVSSDGTLAAFICDGQVYVERTDGTARRALTNFRWSSAASPVISADGSRVVFALGPVSKYSFSSPGAIYSILTDGTRLDALYAPRVLNIRGVVDSLSFAGSLFPAIGDLITAFGANFTEDALTVAGERTLPETLNGVSLLVNGRAAPILAVTPWQINAQLPPWVPESTATFQVRFANGSATNITTQEVVTSAPQVLTLPNDPYPDCQSAVFHAGTGVVANQLHPATVGEIVEIYAVGLGPTDPVVLAGTPAPASPPAMAIGPTTVSMSDMQHEMDVPVLFAGLTPGLIGIYQVNVRVPNGLQGRRYVVVRIKNGPATGSSCPFWVH
jgi:uncharacterized protein (TIGR03437 family)